MPCPPLISVIIPCFNYAGFLPKAINSVLNEKLNTEIIVVDDGSTEDIQAVVKNFKGIVYFRQESKGVSAARNYGIEKSKGKYCVFLDADDWLIPGGLSKNLEIMEANPGCGMVVGSHCKYHEDKKLYGKNVRHNLKRDPYQMLLGKNYIQMMASVLFSIKTVKEHYFDERIRGGEDYELFLKIGRNYKIINHNTPVAVYRLHTNNSSGASFTMLDDIRVVMERESDYVKNAKEKKLLEKGKKYMSNYYLQAGAIAVLKTFLNGKLPDINDLIILKQERPDFFFMLRDDFKKEFNHLITINSKEGYSRDTLAFLTEPEQNPWLRRIRNQFKLRTIIWRLKKLKNIISNRRFASMLVN